MRSLYDLNCYRDCSRDVMRFYGSAGDGNGGVFLVPVSGESFRVIASVGEGWDHVSASHISRCPTWEEMDAIKRMFFRDDEYAFQLHVPQTEHINVHPHCLHLWRPHRESIPIPPAWMVG